MDIPIKSAEDLASQTSIKYGMYRNGATANFFRSTQIDTYRKMNNWMISQPEVLTDNSNDGIARVKSDTDYKSVPKVVQDLNEKFE